MSTPPRLPVLKPRPSNLVPPVHPSEHRAAGHRAAGSAPLNVPLPTLCALPGQNIGVKVTTDDPAIGQNMGAKVSISTDDPTFGQKTKGRMTACYQQRHGTIPRIGQPKCNHAASTDAHTHARAHALTAASTHAHTHSQPHTQTNTRINTLSPPPLPQPVMITTR